MNNQMSLNDFKRWKVPVIKDYLKKRGVQIARKNKDELCALAYAAHLDNKSIVPSQSDQDVAKAIDYATLLTSGKYRLPDPFHELDNWQDEHHGVENWPPTMHVDIAEYLLTNFQVIGLPFPSQDSHLLIPLEPHLAIPTY
jgi:hypothetical protein